MNTTTPYGKPIGKLPKNALRATSISYVFSEGKGKSYGFFRCRHLPGPRLMTWGANVADAEVLANPDQRFVWVGIVVDILPGAIQQRRNNYEYCL